MPVVLTLNGGSSSIRFALFDGLADPHLRLEGRIEGIGSAAPRLLLRHLPAPSASPRATPPRSPPWLPGPAPPRGRTHDHGGSLEFLLDWLEEQPLFASVRAVGHRVVHGMKHTRPERITPRLLADLRRFVRYDPEHLPRELALMEAIGRRHPRLPQVACFDTAFHRTLPEVARVLPIPRRYRGRLVERYGFHGLSYAYLMEELGRLAPAEAGGRVILAHLGSGASLCAVSAGRSIDTTMGFTPAGGLVMATRSGDLDPGLLAYLAEADGMTPARLQRLLTQESGMLGVSGTSGDVRLLLARQQRDPRAALALALFCRQATKWIGAFAAVLGGLDALVFAGGIGENAAPVRAAICAGLGFLGVTVDTRRNERGAAVISTPAGRVPVRIIHTDEELMIARSVVEILELRP